MNRTNCCFLLFVLVLSSSGCTMCKSSYDCMYPAFGGVRPRVNMSQGRVGSAFDPAGGPRVKKTDAAPSDLDEGEFDDLPPSPDEVPEAPLDLTIDPEVRETAFEAPMFQ